jgi:hypothetical protein
LDIAAIGPSQFFKLLLECQNARIPDIALDIKIPTRRSALADAVAGTRRKGN